MAVNIPSRVDSYLREAQNREPNNRESNADEKGNPVPASHYEMPGDWPAETLTTVMFEERQDKTRLTLRHVGIPSGVMSEMAEAGWNGSLDKLAESLEKEKSI